MKKHPDCKALSYGFSLVEMSIVIVIIGLLVGGIAGLRSYVKNAELTTMMNESKIFINAFAQFQTRYNSPPGDYFSATSAWADTQAANTTDSANHNGDGNGLIRATGTAPGNTAERYYAFQHLALAGFIQGKYTGAPNGTGGATVGLNVPGSSKTGAAFFYDHPSEVDGFVPGGGGLDSLYAAGNYGNVLWIAGLNANATTIPNQPFLSGKQAYQIDDKFDDGKPDAGNIMAPYTGVTPLCIGAAGGYATNVEDPTCMLIVKMQ